MRKQYIALSLLATIFIGATLYQNELKTLLQGQSTQETEDISTRSFFKQSSFSSKNIRNQNLQQIQEKQNILTYKVTKDLQIFQTPTNQGGINTAKESTITGYCNVQSLYDWQHDIFELAVNFYQIDREKGVSGVAQQQNQQDAAYKQQEGHSTISQDGKTIEGEIPQGSFRVKHYNFPFYLVKVKGRSGLILDIQAEDGYEEDTVITWMTEHLINDIMPELRRGSSFTRIEQEDTLGKVSAKYSYQDINSQEIKLKKKYSHNDYTQVHHNLKHLSFPKIDYKREIKLHKKSGIVLRGQSQFQFDHGQIQNLDNISSDQLKGAEALGFVTGRVHFNFDKIDAQDNEQTIYREMLRYREQMTFHRVKLSHEKKPKVRFGNGQNEPFETKPFVEPDQVIYDKSTETDFHYHPKLSQSDSNNTLEEEEEEYQEKDNDSQEKLTDIFDIGKIVQRAAEELKEREEEERKAKEQEDNLRKFSQYGYSDRLTTIKVFGNEIHVDFKFYIQDMKGIVRVDLYANSKIIKNFMEVKWDICKQNTRNKDYEESYTIFEATYPLLGGLVDIPVQAKAKIQYGFEGSLQKYGQYCNFDFKPYIKGTLYADGKVSIADIADAGIYSEGTFLDTQLDLNIHSRSGYSHIALDLHFIGFQLNIGVLYSNYKCAGINIPLLKEQEQGEAEKQDNKEENISLTEIDNRTRRQLSIFSWVKKAYNTVKKGVEEVVHVVKEIAKPLIDIGEEALEKLCSKSEKHKQIYGKKFGSYRKNLFKKTFNFGI